MKHIKKINEGWSDDYVTDFTDHGFQVVENPSEIRGVYKGVFVTTVVNDWFAEMVDKMTIEYKVLRTKTFFNSITGTANFEVEVTKPDVDSVNITVGRDIVKYIPSKVNSFNLSRDSTRINNRIWFDGRLESGQKKQFGIHINNRVVSFSLGTRGSGINIDKENLEKLFSLIDSGQVTTKNVDTINSFKTELLFLY